MPHALQMIGLCRFSFLFSEGTGFARNTSVGEGDYDEARLERRVGLFETITLPSLAAQTDMDFSLVILIGRRLPARFKSRLAAITAPHPQFVLHEDEEGQPHMDLCKQVLLTHRNPDCKILGEFRMDDDDAVAVDFVEKSRTYATSLDPLIQTGRPVELDFCNGLALQFDGPKAKAKQIVAAHWGCAQVFFNLAETGRTAFHQHHYKSWHHDLCLSAPDPLMFVRSFHDYNDSGREWDKLRGTNAKRATWSRRYGLDLDGVLA